MCKNGCNHASLAFFRNFAAKCATRSRKSICVQEEVMPLYEIRHHHRCCQYAYIVNISI